jgi:hypothetical protein
MVILDRTRHEARLAAFHPPDGGLDGEWTDTTIRCISTALQDRATYALFIASCLDEG